MVEAELEELLVADAAAWRAWLVEHGADSPGVWLVLTKKGGTTTALGYQDAVDEAICHGWIDGQLRTRDAASMCIRFTPRRARSVWSARNVDRVERLTAAGRMQPAGIAQVDAAKADGRWDRAYGGAAIMEPPVGGDGAGGRAGGPRGATNPQKQPGLQGATAGAVRSGRPSARRSWDDIGPPA